LSSFFQADSRQDAGMTNIDRSEARKRVLAAAEAAGTALSDEGFDFATMDVLKIAAAFAAKYLLLTGEFGTEESQRSAADTLRDEFIAQIRHFEDVYMGGGERL
jgi:hypothetical protein